MAIRENLSVDSGKILDRSTEAAIARVVDNRISAIFPVGTIHITYTNINPGEYLMGTWVAFGSGRTLVGVNDNDPDFSAVGQEGGEKTHTLTVDEMPAHSHRAYIGYNNSGSGQDVIGYDGHNQGAAGYQSKTGNNSHKAIEDTGGNAAHNIMQPYTTVYFWRRIS